MGEVTIIQAAKALPIPANPAAAAVVVTIKVAAYAIGGLMLLSYFTNTKSKTVLKVGKDGVDFRHEVDDR